MTDKEKLIQAENILHDICMSFETEGCEDCGTVSTSEVNKARKFLGWDPIDTDSED